MALCSSAVNRGIGGVVTRWQLGLLLLAVLGLGAARTPSGTDEFRVIATFMIHFAQFTTWPKTAPAVEPAKEPAVEGPIVVGVVGPDPFGEALDEVFRGETVRGRSFLVKRFREGEVPKDCHLVFVGDVGVGAMRDVVKSLTGRPVLTLSGRADFSDAGGMVVFGMERGRVVFEINREAVAQSGLTIHSRLLSLGRIRGEQEKR